MRKTISVLLLFILCSSLAGCGGSEQPSLPVEISYETAVVSYLGPEGTYTQEACGVFFEKQGSYIPFETVDDAVEALVSGDSTYTVIPQENTIGGAVTDYVDTLLAKDDVSVVGEVELPISQNLLVIPGTKLPSIKTVYSHKQGIAQGRDWLAENLPDVEVIEVSSTAEGARMVSESRDTSCAAIASAACADVYGLEILAGNIQNNDSNKTRFYVLSQDEPATAPADRIAFVAMGDAEGLPSLMEGIKDQGMTLITVHDRPLKTELGEYYYLIECADSSYADYSKLVEKSPFEFRFLGSFEAK